jgi:CRISPR-associated protein Cas1
MQTLYISQQGCSVSLCQEQLLVKQKDDICQQVQLPLIEQVLVFGQSQVTTQALRACLKRNIPILYLSRMGQCHGRLLPMQQGYRQLARYQSELSEDTRLSVAKAIVQAKLRNSRVILQRQARQRSKESIGEAIQQLEALITRAGAVSSNQVLMGVEGAGAASYFSVLGDCLVNPEFNFTERSRRPPADPVNALLSFGYQLLWNHLYSLIEGQNLDPYDACLHQGTRKHAALASDLVEAFRAPLADSLMLYLVNHRVMEVESDFTLKNGGCYLNGNGRRKYLRAFIARMEEEVKAGGEEPRPRWDLLMSEVKGYKKFIYDQRTLFQPYSIR